MFQIIVDPAPSLITLPASEGISLAPIVAALVILVLLICLIAVIRRRWQSPELMNLTPEQVKAKWEEIIKISGQGTTGMKLSLIEADKLLDHVLKSMMIPGETLADRLKMAAYNYPAIKKVWSAHKLRNQLVHDSAFERRSSEARRALSDFHDALRTLRIL